MNTRHSGWRKTGNDVPVATGEDTEDNEEAVGHLFCFRGGDFNIEFSEKDDSKFLNQFFWE